MPGKKTETFYSTYKQIGNDTDGVDYLSAENYQYVQHVRRAQFQLQWKGGSKYALRRSYYEEVPRYTNPIYLYI